MRHIRVVLSLTAVLFALTAAATGQRQMDASAIVDYFKPLIDWLEVQNRGRQCGWQ